MNNTNRREFSAAMMRVMAIYDQELTQNMLDAWWGALQGYPFDDVARALHLHATDPDRGRFRPVPADAIFHLTSTIPVERRNANAALLRLRESLMAPIHESMYRAEADLKLGLLSAEEHQRRLIEGNRQITMIYKNPEFSGLLQIEHG